MADQSDVETVLVGLAAGALYPNGSTVPSIIGADCKIYRGWPTSGTLDAELSAGRVNITVFPAGEPGRNTSRYQATWTGRTVQPSLKSTVSGNAVTFSGDAAAGQVAGVLVDDVAYAYRVRAGDTPEIVAANLAAAMRDRWLVNLSGSTMTIAGVSRVLARIVADVPQTQEVRRQEQRFRITCWCPTPAFRDIAATTIDQALAGLPFIVLPDGARGRLRYHGTLVFDQSQDALLYRRDLLYDVEYPTLITLTQPAMLFGQVGVNAAVVYG